MPYVPFSILLRASSTRVSFSLSRSASISASSLSLSVEAWS